MKMSHDIVGIGSNGVRNDPGRDGLATVKAVKRFSLWMDHGVGGLRCVLHLIQGLAVHNVDVAACVNQDPGDLAVADRDCDHEGVIVRKMYSDGIFVGEGDRLTRREGRAAIRGGRLICSGLIDVDPSFL